LVFYILFFKLIYFIFFLIIYLFSLFIISVFREGNGCGPGTLDTPTSVFNRRQARAIPAVMVTQATVRLFAGNLRG